MALKGKVHSVNVSTKKGTVKMPVTASLFIEDLGLEGDAHAGHGLMQVSLLAFESIDRQNKTSVKELSNADLSPGDFAENITTQGLDLPSLGIGRRFKVGEKAVLELTAIGKECHRPCAVFFKSGSCIMPREGIFAKVITGGKVFPGDDIEVMKDV